MGTILSRVAALEAAAEKAGSSLLTIHYTDGRTAHITGGDAIELISSGEIGGITKFTGGPQNGLLPDLLTDLLNF